MSGMPETVGVREAKNRFSELTAQVNATGSKLLVLKNNRPWVVILPADSAAADRRARLAKFRTLTSSIEEDAVNEPDWDYSISDHELLGEERMRRFG